MTDTTDNVYLKYIKEHLIAEILNQLNNEKLIKYEVEHASGLDGFMSALYNIQLYTETQEDSKQRLLVAKFMKGDVSFREASKSYIQFANEVFVYNRALPAFAKLLATTKLNITTDDWVPHPYVAKFGYIEGLSSAPNVIESVLVLEHLKPHDYVMGPRLYLTPAHLLSMCKLIGQYHAMSYALQLTDPVQLERLQNAIISLPFINDGDPNDVKDNFYRFVYRAAIDRLFDFYDRKVGDGETFNRNNPNDLKLIERMNNLREKYGKEPARLLEKIRRSVYDCEDDKLFGAILHGDYNRNNVLFRYAQAAGDQAECKVADVKMIDFQELRFSTPCLDLSFFMYMNTTADIREALWMDMLKTYHKNMYDTLKATVEAKEKFDEARLVAYSFDKFHAHFSRYAFYGVMICLHFLPWMLSSAEECAKVSQLFETNVRGAEFHRVSIEIGGDAVNMKLLDVLRHACKMGYMDEL